MEQREDKLICNLCDRICNGISTVGLTERLKLGLEERSQLAILEEDKRVLRQLSTSKLGVVVHALLDSIATVARLADKADNSEQQTTTYLQTHIQILSLLGSCMEGSWNHIRLQFKNVEGRDEAERIQLKQGEESILPPPLEESLASRVAEMSCKFL